MIISFPLRSLNWINVNDKDFLYYRSDLIMIHYHDIIVFKNDDPNTIDIDVDDQGERVLVKLLFIILFLLSIEK